MVRDLGSANGTFVNGTRIAGDVVLENGDVIAFGQNGPAVEFHALPGEPDGAAVSDAVRRATEPMSSPRAESPRARASVTANEAAKRGSAIATDLAALRIVEPCLRLEAAPLRRT